MLDVKEKVLEIRSYAESPLKEARVVDEMALGEWIRQGDVNVVRIEAPAKWRETLNRQLAIGTTIGSRHTVDESVTVLENPENGVVKRSSGLSTAVCLGPQIVSKDRFTISHPEHADFSLPPGCYQVQFQTDPSTQQRVQD